MRLRWTRDKSGSKYTCRALYALLVVKKTRSGWVGRYHDYQTPKCITLAPTENSRQCRLALESLEAVWNSRT